MQGLEPAEFIEGYEDLEQTELNEGLSEDEPPTCSMILPPISFSLKLPVCFYHYLTLAPVLLPMSPNVLLFPRSLAHQ